MKRFYAIFLSLFLVAGFAVKAQDLTQVSPDLLDALKKDGGGLEGLTERTGPATKLSPVDKARSKVQKLPLNISNDAIEQDDTLSVIEWQYQMRMGQKAAVRQFGYDIFNNINMLKKADSGNNQDLSLDLDVNGRLPDNYVLGIGDEVVVVLQGTINRNIITKVDREGRVVVEQIPPVAAAGRSFEAFEEDFKQTVAGASLGTEAFVSIGNLRAITISVFGSVGKPGIYQMTSFADPVQALAKAGGVLKTGSLRNIRVILDKDCETANNCPVLDLYELMNSGKGADIALKDGARIIVPRLGETLAITGDVLVPGIYELKSGKKALDASELLALAGGSLRPRGYELVRSSIANDGLDYLSVLNDDTQKLLSSDILSVRPKGNKVVGQVRVSGEVAIKGVFPLEANETLSKLFKDRSFLGDRPYLPLAVIQVTHPQSQAKVYKAVNISRVLAGVEDFKLSDQDHIYILNASDIDFLSSPSLRKTLLTQTDESQCRSLAYLAQYITMVGQNRFNAISRSAFMSDFYTGAEKDIPKAPELDVNGVGEIDNCSPLFESQPELLPFVIEKSVSLIGSVRRPGVLPVAGSASLEEIIGAAGGLSNNADLSQIEILHADESAIKDGAEWQYFNGVDQSLDVISVSSRSSIRIPAIISEEEPGTVLLSGEFARPGVYAIRKGETMRQVMERAGGITKFAYPYGALLTRKSVAEQQREGFRRASREINNALASAAVKASLGGDVLSSASALANNLATVDVAGRMVVEADPTMLISRPDLDVILESGDRMHMPKRPSYVLVAGDVLNPGALGFSAGKSIMDYVKESGGLSISADDERVFVVYPNGVAKPVSLGSWGDSDESLPPGSTIVVPKDLDPFTMIELTTQITQVLSNLSVSIASLAIIGK